MNDMVLDAQIQDAQTDAQTDSKPASMASDVLSMRQTFEAQRKAFAANRNTDAKMRIRRLEKLKAVFVDNKDAFCEAISADFSHRSIHETQFGEILTVISHINETIKHLPKWMKKDSRSISLLQQPAKGWVQYQPLGVVGIISPWNYPIVLSMGPLIAALAAGNHAMIKPSSAVPNFTRVLAEKFSDAFPSTLVHVVQGSGELSKQFSKMDFNQLTFTGSSRVGKLIMTDAADSLTPILLELGGKSPAVVHGSMDFDTVATRLVVGKFWNAGQTCVAPDYVMVPKGRAHDMAEAVKAHIEASYPTLLTNPDYTSMISADAKAEKLEILHDALAKGATAIEVNPAGEDFEGSQKIAPTIVLGATSTMRILQEEIFAPLMPIIEYDSIDDAISYITARPHPLALYYFDYNDSRADYFAQRTTSGHLGINQLLTHVTQDNLPFGGVGNSGMGKYHGFEGFVTMSNARSVMQHGRVYGMKLAAPPFGKTQELMLDTLIR